MPHRRDSLRQGGTARTRNDRDVHTRAEVANRPPMIIRPQVRHDTEYGAQQKTPEAIPERGEARLRLFRDNPRMGSDEDAPDFIVVGAKVALGRLRRDLAATYARWDNQLEVRRGLDLLGVATPESREKWVDDNIKAGAEREPTGVVLMDAVPEDFGPSVLG